MVDIEAGRHEPRPERTRSTSHPAFGLATAIQKARLIHQAEQTAPVPFVVAVKHLGFSGPTGPALRALAALKMFGIMTEEAGHYRLTNEGLAVLTQQEGARDALGQMALRPEVFRQILAKYPEQLPSNQSLKATLVRDFRLTEATADTIIVALHETLDFVRGSAASSMSNGTPHSDASVHEVAGAEPPAPSTPAAGSAASSPGMATTGSLHVWSLGGGAFVELRSNRALSCAQFGLLKRYVELAEQAERQLDTIVDGQ
jgi:hypothetical protein